MAFQVVCMQVRKCFTHNDTMVTLYGNVLQELTQQQSINTKEI